MKVVVIIFALMLVVAVIVHAVKYVKRENRQRELESFETFKSALQQQLRKRGPGALDFASLSVELNVAPELARKVARSIYWAACCQFLIDGQITHEERNYLVALRDSMTLSESNACRIEASAAESRYKAAALNAMADGVITPEEAEELERLRNRLRLTWKDASEIVGESARDGYLSLFREVIRDGRITPEELEQLRRFRSAMGIGEREANDIVQDEALGLYRQWCSHVLQDGEVTLAEEQGFAWLRSEFNLDVSDTHEYDEQINEVKLITAYRQGNLPSVRTNKILERDEICHWESRCCFRWRTATRAHETDGDLVLTSRQMMFISHSKSFSLIPSRIVEVKLQEDCLVIRSATNRGSGVYFVSDTRIVHAILMGIVRRHKLLHQPTDASADQSRHIAASVRREVHIRDGGRCVQCGATSSLHYDHILPFSRGGGNTVENIQILCGPCNIRKSNHI